MLEMKKDSVSSKFAWNRKMPAVKPQLLPSGWIPVLPGEFGYAVWERNSGQVFVIELRL
jgi:hypothetical protein